MTHSACHFISITRSSATQGAGCTCALGIFMAFEGKQVTRKIHFSFRPRLSLRKNQRCTIAPGILSISRYLPFSTRHRRAIFNARAMYKEACVKPNQMMEHILLPPVQTDHPYAWWNCPFPQKRKVGWRFST